MHFNILRPYGIEVILERLTNISLLGKLLWSLIQHKDKLWVQVISNKYLGNPLWTSVNNARSSIIWRGICKAIESVSEGYNFPVGSGETSFWFDDWIKLGPMSISVTRRLLFAMFTMMALGTLVACTP